MPRIAFATRAAFAHARAVITAGAPGVAGGVPYGAAGSGRLY